MTEACHLSTWHALVTPRVVAEAACGTAAGVTGVVAPAAVGRGLLPCPLLPFLHRHQLAAAAAAAPSPQRPPSLVAWRKRKRAVGVVGTVAAAASAPVAAEWRPPVEAVEAPRGPAPAAACSGGWPSAPSGPAWQPPPAAAACSGSPGAGASRRQPERHPPAPLSIAEEGAATRQLPQTHPGHGSAKAGHHRHQFQHHIYNSACHIARFIGGAIGMPSSATHLQC